MNNRLMRCLESGMKTYELTDDRIIPEPFSASEVFDTIIELNKRGLVSN